MPSTDNPRQTKTYHHELAQSVSYRHGDPGPLQWLQMPFSFWCLRRREIDHRGVHVASFSLVSLYRPFGFVFCTP